MIINKAKEKSVIWKFTNKGNLIVTIPSGGKYTIKELWNDMGYEEQILNRGLRENGIMFVEQIMDLKFKNILSWQHIQTIRPKRGRPPGWYTHINQNKNFATNIIQEKLKEYYIHNLNIFNNLTKKHISTKKLWIAHKDNNELIIGKEHKKGKQEDNKKGMQQMKHYNIITKNLEPTSVLIPCEGCEINIEDKNEECIYRIDKDKKDKIEIPVIYSKTSTSSTATRSFKNRIRMNVKDLYTATDLMENYMRNQEDDIMDNLSNTIEEEDIREKHKYQKIQKWIKCEDEDIVILLDIKEKLKHRKQVKVYTDGSLETTLTESIMGFGWVIPEVKNYEGLTFRGNIKNFPSSTRAELMAIFTTLIVMPTKSKVIIYTDSTCAIQNMKTIMEKINTREIGIKNKNPILLQMINDIMKEKKLKVICHKVKAHSGDKYNEIADSLAKIPGFVKGIKNNIFEGTLITLNYNSITSLNFIPTWKSTPIETPIKDAIKEINRIKSMLNFKYQERFKHIMSSTKCREIDWDLTFKTKHPSKITSDTTNKEDSSRRSFAIKLLCEELPTLSRRYVHKPNLYNSSSCVLCDESIEEDNMHVFTCKRKGNIDPIKGLNNKFKEILMEKIKKEESNIDIKVIWEHINEIDILNYSYEKDYTLSKNYSDLTFFDIIKGFVPSIITTKVIKICKYKKVKAKKIIIDAMEEFQQILKQIWKERCDKVIEWEVNNGITNKDKRIKQTKEKLNTNNQVVKTSNIRKRNNYNINNLKIIEEKDPK
ncbi:hypothetical protein Glove_132g171 [Diversispora epigaea]|uniref:RNase H type-1 domain-containing protein n=1 Tax=Diversispora epigaea TaxID=1348612 RepID=A0A397J651_9GLOM|nr:hypothetical protein Glove_132g171 [Diversispora epigaea]